MFKQLTSNTENLLKAGVFGLFAVLPVLFTSATVESFEFPKTIFLYIVATTLIIWLFIFKKAIKQRPAMPVLVFVAVYGLASLLSSHFYTSLWGYYSRFNGGLYSILCFFFVYFVIINIFTRQDIAMLKKLIVICSLPVSLFAIWQHLNFNLGVDANEVVRVYSTIGQPNWLGAYLASICMVAFGFVNYEGLRKNWLFFAFVFVLAFFGLWFTFSLSALLGFGLGLLYWFVGVRRLNWKRIVAVLAVCFVVVVLQPGIWKMRLLDAYKTIASVEIVLAQNNEENNGATKSKNFAVSDSGVIRKGIWKGTLMIVLTSPKNALIGTGPETFPYQFQKVRPTELNYSSEWDFILNKPHNYYLEILSTTGILGLVAYLWLIGWVFAKGAKTSRPMFLVIFVTNFFSWPVSVINLLFWGIAAESEKDASMLAKEND